MNPMPKPPCCRRLPLATMIACLFAPMANAQPTNGGSLAYHDDYSQVGLSVDDAGHVGGEVKYLFSGTANSGTFGELWASDGAGGVKLSHNWIPLDSEGKPDRSSSIRKAFAALDQNSLSDRKFTLGGGLENGRGFVAAYLSHAVSGSRQLATRQETETSTLTGFENGRPYIDTVTSLATINTYEHPFDWGVGVRAGRYLPEHGLQVSIGADHEWGDNDSSQTTLSLDMEKFFAASPWSVGFRAEAAVHDDGMVVRDNDTRAWLILRYAFSPAPRTPATYTIRTLAASPRAESARVGTGAETTAVAASSVAKPTRIPPVSPDNTGETSTQVVVPTTTPEPKVDSYRTEKRMIKTTASMTADTFFKFDSALLTPAAGQELGKIIGVITNQGYSDKISLIGHTCDIGSEAYNRKLSLRRAESVKKYLVEQGGIKTDDITAEGKGESEPAYPNNRESRHKNRRVDMEFLTYVDKEVNVTVPVEQAASTTTTATATSPLPAPVPVASDFPEKKADASATPATEPAIVWRSEEVEPEPDWIQHGLFGAIPHKRTVDYYRVIKRTVATSTERTYVNRAPIAGNDSYTVVNGAPLGLPVLANDSDPDNDTLQIASVSQPSLGSVSISGNNLIYTPNNASVGGADSFTYTVTDGQGGTATATVSINVIANLAPIAANDSYTTSNGQAISMPVLANDSDPDNDPLTISAVGQPTRGTATLSGNVIVYTPASASESGTDSFTYTISDGKGGSASATVSVTLTANQAPIAVNDSYTAVNGQSVSMPVLVNDSDPDNDTLAILAVGQPTRGTASISGTAIVYTPTSASENGTDSFTYTIGDGKGGSATATVSVTLVANQAPSARDDAYWVPGVGDTLLNVLANDTDPEGDTLSILSFSQPGYGSISLVGNSLLFTSSTPFGMATFTYTISDGHGGTSSATVSLIDP